MTHYIKQRLCERSTWAGLAVLLGILVPQWAPQIQQAGDALAVLAGLACTVAPDKAGDQ